DHIHLSPYLSYLSIVLAGSAANVRSYPSDLLRTILASQGNMELRLNRLRSSDQGSDLQVKVSLTFNKVVCHRLDVVKKRFQIIGLPRDSLYGAGVEHHAYNGISDALRCISEHSLILFTLQYFLCSF
ncbi:hypothetical protein MKW98_003139, partial [Papaver atlanticum]